jgi:CheY-like chemotaxis protein
VNGTSVKILIVEDQFLIARQVEMIVSAAGHRVVGIASSLAEACRMGTASGPDIAFVDLSLADGLTGAAVARFLIDECHASVVYTTANLRRLPQDLSGAFGAVEKPFTKGGLLAALGYVVAVVRDGLCPDKVPRSLNLPSPGHGARGCVA